jgi:hypothetical protein
MKFVPLIEGEAGHFFPTKTHDGLRYDLRNIHLECHHDNCDNPDHLKGYKRNLINKIGLKAFKELCDDAAKYIREGHRWQRTELEEMIAKFKKLNKELENTENVPFKSFSGDNAPIFPENQDWLNQWT